jgi:hypothetical protein
MTAPYHFRRGWERERLAEYILSRISFVAKPSTVSDDLGSDFYCTLFRLEKKGAVDYPLPLSSFAIQIKSNDRPQDFSANIAYLEHLEIPFFWGVIDESESRLSVFSGENLPVFFSHVGGVKKLKIKPTERNQMVSPYEPLEGRQENYTVFFPKIVEIHAQSNREVLNNNVAELNRICSFIHGNISTRKTEEYLFEGYDGQSVTIIAGPYSAKKFRDNFMKRLAENFYNLRWIYENNQYKEKPGNLKALIEEFNIYEDTYMRILKIYPQIPAYLENIYRELKLAFNQDNSAS